MATPILDAAILKLRRKLGDIYDELGKEIVASTSPSGTQIYVGDPSLRSTWTSAELLDIYNDSVSEFIAYCIKYIPKDKLADFIPGYIRYATVTRSALSIGGVSASLLATDSIVPPVEHVLDLKDSGWITSQSPLRLGVQVPPDKFFASVVNLSTATTGQLIYSPILTNPASYDRQLIALNVVGSSVEIVYVAKYTPLAYNGAADIGGFTNIAMKRIQILAEVYAQRYRSQEVRDLSDIEKKEMIETDVLLRRQ